MLIAGWLRSRAGIEVALDQSEAMPHAGVLDASALLSEELNVHGRDPVYEEAAKSAGRL